MSDIKEIIEQTKQELRRGYIVLTVLALLDKPHYGYSLIQTLEDKGIPIEGNTLYPLLRRLEKKGLLKSEWETDGSKPRKYYIITNEGQEVLDGLVEAYHQSTKSLDHILRENENE